LRSAWILLIGLALVTFFAFDVVEALGATDGLQYIATTVWSPGAPSAWHIMGATAALLAWVAKWVLAPTFLLAAVPVLAAERRYGKSS
jgi:hypothetical protein